MAKCAWCKSEMNFGNSKKVGSKSYHKECAAEIKQRAKNAKTDARTKARLNRV